MISLILARGGSKGIPRKNIKELNEKPLLFYPIEAAVKTKWISKVFVSTDDEEIAELAIKKGAIVIMRPSDISGDNSTDIEAFKHFCLETKHLKEPIVHLRATTPILDHSVIDEAILIYKENIDNFTSLRSAHETSESAFKFYIKGEKYWEPIDKILSSKPRQMCTKTYTPNGYVDIVNPKVFLNSESLYGDKIYPFITKYSPEIDTLDDFHYIEYLISKNLI